MVDIRVYQAFIDGVANVVGANDDMLHARVRLGIVSASYGVLVIASGRLLWDIDREHTQDMASAVRVGEVFGFA